MLRRMIIFLLALCCAFAGYAYAETIELENGLTAERKNGYWTLLDASGHILMEKLTAQPQFRGSYAVVKLGTGIKEEGLSSEDVEVSRRGLIDDRGKICIPPEYDQMALINDSGTVAAEKNGLYGMLDANGKVLLDFKYKYINESFNGHCTVAVEDAHGDFAWGVVDEQGKMILPAEYKSIDIYPDGTMIVGHAEKIGDFEMNTLYGYMNMAGEWIIEPRFASAEPFQYGYAPVRMRVTIRDPFSDTGRARRWGLIDARGEFVLPAEFDGIDLFSEQRHDTVFSQYGTGKKGTYMVASNHDRLVYSGPADKFFYFDTIPEDTNKYDENSPRVMELKEQLIRYMESDCCDENTAATADDVSGVNKFPYGPKRADHLMRQQEERACIPEGYTIDL